jgi:spore protease
MVQLNDTGISPGAGVGNFQKGLNRETLGVPVLALGIPLVLSAESILESGLRRTGNGYLAQNLQTLLEEDFLSMVVTPKDIDAMVKDGARLLSQGLNLAFFGENYGPLCAMLP